jgi:predicted N-acetyltransferase YhbS
MLIRELKRDEIENIWKINRGEVINNIYYLVEGSLVLRPEYYEMQGWQAGEPERYTPIFNDCYDRGGYFLGAFVSQYLVGAAILENKFIGKQKDQLQLKFLHVDRSFRNQGIGKTLFDTTVKMAKELGARQLYISATPSENTINFYFHLGCIVTKNIDSELFTFEPEDIHLEYTIP